MAKNKSYFLIGVVTDDPEGWKIDCAKKSKAIHFRLETKLTRLAKKDVIFIESHLDAIRNNPSVPSPKNDKVPVA